METTTWKRKTEELNSKFVSINFENAEFGKTPEKAAKANMPKLFTKNELIEMSVRLGILGMEIPEYIYQRSREFYGKMPESKFIRVMRKGLKLNVCIFAPDRYIIKYGS